MAYTKEEVYKILKGLKDYLLNEPLEDDQKESFMHEIYRWRIILDYTGLNTKRESSIN